MKFLYLILMLCLPLFFSHAASGAPSGSVTVLGPRDGSFPCVISLHDVVSDGSSLLSSDPNFDAGTPSLYKGVPLRHILERAGAEPVTGVTLVGRDQYTVYLPKKIVDNPGVVLVSERNGEPLSDYRGGPLKLLFPRELKMNLSAYCWYVETLIPDDYEDPRMVVRVDGNMMRYTPKDFDGLNPEKRTLYISLPDGYRCNFLSVRQPSEVTLLALSSLVGDGDFAGRRVTFTPFSGQAITLPLELLIDCGVFLVYRINGELIHPALGGPFSLYFPMTGCQTLDGIIPELGALFFLNEISID